MYPEATMKFFSPQLVDGERITPVSSSMYEKEIRRCEGLVAECL